MAKILTKEQCDDLIGIPYEEYHKLVITDKPTAITATDTRKFNERLIYAMIELHSMVAAARADITYADTETKKAKAEAMAKMAEARIRARHRTADEKGKSDAQLSGITEIDPSGLTEADMKALADRYAAVNYSSKAEKRFNYLSDLYDAVQKIGKRVDAELIAFGIENKMNIKLGRDKEL